MTLPLQASPAAAEHTLLSLPVLDDIGDHMTRLGRKEHTMSAFGYMHPHSCCIPTDINESDLQNMSVHLRWANTALCIDVKKVLRFFISHFLSYFWNRK